LLRADMKYPGVFNEAIIDIPCEVASIEEMADCFTRFHREQYGYTEEVAPDIINIRLSALGKARKPLFIRSDIGAEDSRHAQKSTRKAYFHELNGMTDTPIYDGLKMVAGNKAEGPAIIELPTTTIVIRPGQVCSIDDLGNYNIILSGVSKDERN
jgi:N-methylhydantoinase A